MKRLKFIFITILFLFIWRCNDSTLEPQQSSNQIIGTWEYSNEIGFVDSLDPVNIFSPTFTFNPNLSFEETAMYIRLPEKRYLGYKYVKTGNYTLKSDTNVLTIKKEIYVNFADSLKPKPSPLDVDPYETKFLFIVNKDTLKLARLGVLGIQYDNYFKK